MFPLNKLDLGLLAGNSRTATLNLRREGDPYCPIKAVPDPCPNTAPGNLSWPLVAS